ncbi:DUF3124 domain-containing protein [Desulfocurvus vexinensis]|uniref:DUF3124 domain-containing protein n=1 Tax=Desulfocurvus vexinensis TaxID=399548 RepID=UPI00048FE02F|nr:DUF3124 domain-containing protein [Desulfocurvus vexinensis]
MPAARAALAALLTLLTLALPALAGTAAPGPAPSTGQTLYVPVYSHVYHGPKNRDFPLTCTLSIRNTDPHHSFRVEAVEFYNSHGGLVRGLIDGPRPVRPMGTLEFIVDESDNDGGSGANFVIRWVADTPMNPPLVEAVMIGTSSNQGISFTSRAVEILP